MTRITIVAGACLVGLGTSAGAIEKLKCVGTEPFWDATFTDRRATFNIDQSLRDYPAPTYKPARGSSWRYAVSVTAHKGRSTLLAFIVEVTGLPILDRHAKEAPSSNDAYHAYCSDSMSEHGYPYIINLFLDGTPYTGCCTTASNPSVAAPENRQ